MFSSNPSFWLILSVIIYNWTPWPCFCLFRVAFMSSSCLITTQPVACVFFFLSSLRPSQFLGVMVSRKHLVPLFSPWTLWLTEKAKASEDNDNFAIENSLDWYLQKITSGTLSFHFSRPSQRFLHRPADSQDPFLWVLKRTPGTWKLLAWICVPVPHPLQLMLLMPHCHPLVVPGLCSAMRRGEDHGVEMGFFSMLISSCRCEQVLQEHRRNDWLQALHLVEDLLGLLYTSCLPGKIWGILCAWVSLERPLDGV